jgi:hypothetical protein
MLGKDKLVFDTSATLSDNDNVGAFLRASDGTLITHTGGALNVNVSNASIAVTATDLDIRDLVFATDKVDVSGSSVTVTATNLDIRDLTHATDSVKVGDGTDFLAINTDGSILGMYAEDSAHASGDIGAQMLAVRQDTPGSLVSADGDYAPLQVDSAGRLRVISDLTAAFDFVYAEDSAHASGDSGAFMLAVRNDGGATSLTSADGDSAIAVDEFGRVLTVGSSVTAYAEDSAHTSGDQGDFILAVRQDTLSSSTSADGDYAAFKVNSLGALYTSPVGNVADDAADSGNPIKVGSRAESGALTAVADGDRADLLSDSFRRIYVNNSSNISVEDTAVLVGTSATALPASNLTGRKKIYVQNLANAPIFLGGSGVTTSNGIRIAAGAVWEDEVGDDVNLFAIKAAGTADVRVLELA